MSCLFCRILAHEVPARILYEDEQLALIQDVNPQAPVHVLVLPRKHIATLNDLAPEDDALIGAMFRRAAAYAAERGIARSGYRTLFNCNAQAGQTIFHLHLHLVGGRTLGWPPG
jgi:histidine triad (HIT) family protein